MRVEITVCNVCQAPDRSTRPYAVENADRRVELDLCEEHAAPLEALLPRAAPSRSRAPAKKASRPRRSQTPIMTMEEIERRKARQRAQR